MTHRMLLMIAGGVLMLSAAAPAEPTVSELTDQGWQEVKRPAQTPAVDPVLVRADELLGQRQYNAARVSLVRWLQAHPLGAPHRDLALFLMGEALYQEGDRLRSFYYLDELMDEYPGSPLFYRALEKQYQIADAYLQGYKRRFLLLPIVSAEDEAIEMMYRIQHRSPGSPLAEKALLRTADYYYASGDYDLASDAYAAYARNYPRSPQIPQVLLREAFANFAQFRGLRFDATPLVDARTQLIGIVAQYPELAARENLPALIERIDRTFAQKILVTAEFYRRTGKPQAAAWNYEFLIRTYPNAPEAANARRALAQLPSSARQGLGPRAGEGYAPATQPAEVD